MSDNLKIIFFSFIISFIVTILQIVIFSRHKQYNSKDFIEIIKNWKNIPILDISIYSYEKNFKEKDSITIG